MVVIISKIKIIAFFIEKNLKIIILQLFVGT